MICFRYAWDNLSPVFIQHRKPLFCFKIPAQGCSNHRSYPNTKHYSEKRLFLIWKSLHVHTIFCYPRLILLNSNTGKVNQIYIIHYDIFIIRNWPKKSFQRQKGTCFASLTLRPGWPQICDPLASPCWDSWCTTPHPAPNSYINLRLTSNSLPSSY